MKKSKLFRIVAFVLAFTMVSAFAIGSAEPLGGTFSEEVQGNPIEGDLHGDLLNDFTNFSGDIQPLSGETISLSTPQDIMTHFGSGTASASTAGNTYILANNINMEGIEGFDPMPTFEGIFRGNNNSIQNLTINTTTVTGKNYAAFVGTLAFGAIIESVSFTNLDVLASQQVAAIANVSNGTITEVFVQGKMNTSITTIVAGGLVGQYSSVIIDGVQSVGNIIDCSVQMASTELGTQTTHGGVIGRNLVAGNIDLSQKVQRVYWDKDISSAVNSVASGTALNSIVGVNMPSSLDVILEREVAYTSLVTYVPSGSVPNATWAITGADNAIREKDDGTGFLAEQVGSNVVTHALKVGGTSFIKTVTINVVADKEALLALLNQAKTIYNFGSNPPAYYGATYTEYQAALNDAQDVYDDRASTELEVSEAITNLEEKIAALVVIDRSRLSELIDDYAFLFEGLEPSFYDQTSFAAFSTAYGLAEDERDLSTANSSTLRNAYNSLETTRNGLLLLLGDTTIERSADNTQLIITIDGYQHTGKQFSTFLSSTLTHNPTPTTSTTLTHGLDGPINDVITITVDKATMSAAVYNLDGEFTVTITDNGVKSAPVTLNIDERPNFVTKDVTGIDLGIVELATNINDVSKNISGVELLYNPTTGSESVAYTTNGSVIEWEFVDSAESTATTGVKEMVGIIALSGVYSNPDTYKAYATLEVVDRAKLNSLVDMVNAYLEKDYTPDTWAPFKVALDNAKLVRADKDATGTEIIDATDALDLAITGLKLQPEITLKQSTLTIGTNEIFEALTYVTSASDKDGDLAYAIEITVDGEATDEIDTSVEGDYEVIYSVTNNDGITATATLDVFVREGGPTVSTTGGSSSGTGGGTDGDTEIEIPKGDVIIGVTPNDVLTSDELAQGYTVDADVNIITDHSKIQAIIDGDLAGLLTGTVTIDGVFDVKLYKVLNGERTEIPNSAINGLINIYLPISQLAIDSNDNGVIHELSGGGYEVLTITLMDKSGVQMAKISTMSFSEFGVTYGGGISQIASAMDTNVTTATPTGSTTTDPLADPSTPGETVEASGEGGGGGSTSGSGTSPTTGDEFPLSALIITVIVCALALGGLIAFSKIKNKKENKDPGVISDEKK